MHLLLYLGLPMTTRTSRLLADTGPARHGIIVGDYISSPDMSWVGVVSQVADICKLAQLYRAAKMGGHALRMPGDFPKTLRRALFRAATSSCVDALDHDDQRWARFQPGFGMCAARPPPACPSRLP